MTLRGSILWPSPGLPAILGEDAPSVQVIVGGMPGSVEGCIDSVKAWSLRSVSSGRAVPLERASMRRLPQGEGDWRLGGLAQLGLLRGQVLFVLDFSPVVSLKPASGRSVELYDLMADGRLLRARSVAVWGSRADRLRLAFASDLHLGGFWERLSDGAARHLPRIARRMLNPAGLWERFVEEANRLGRRGELDLVVLGGDLVECVHDRPRGGRENGGTNVDRLVRALAPLEVPSISIPGNHDHRAFPWRAALYGLRSLGLSGRESRAVLKATGHQGTRWPRLSDVDALRTTDERNEPVLTHYLRQVAPAGDFCMTLGGVRLVFVSSGADAVASWNAVERARHGLFVRSFRTLWKVPDAEGLREEQVDWIRAGLSADQGTAVFCHAPLIYGAGWEAGDGRSLCLAARGNGGLSGRVALEQRLAQAGLRTGVCFRNGATLAHALAGGGGPAVVLSGHVHCASAWKLCRSTLSVTAASLAPLDDPLSGVLMVTAPAIGQQGHAGDSRPGFLLASFEGGRLSRLDRRMLLPARNRSGRLASIG